MRYQKNEIIRKIRRIEQDIKLSCSHGDFTRIDFLKDKLVKLKNQIGDV